MGGLSSALWGSIDYLFRALVLLEEKLASNQGGHGLRVLPCDYFLLSEDMVKLPEL